MLKTYRIIPLVFILFFFGFTLITVAPVLAEDSPEFVACLQMPFGNQNEARQKKNCFRDVARLYHRQLRDSVQSVVPLETSGGEVAELNARIAESESQVATLTTTNTQLQGDYTKLKFKLRTIEDVLKRLRSKVQINEKGVDHMGVLREKVKDHYCTSNALKKTHGPVWCDHMRVRLDAYARDVEDELLQIVREDKTLADYRETLEKSDRPELPVCDNRCSTLTGICAGPAPGIPCRPCMDMGVYCGNN
jgi:hypothetical protein